MPQTIPSRKDSRNAFEFPVAPFLPDFIAAWRPMWNSAQAWNGAVGNAVTAAHREWIDFINRRLKEDAALTMRLAACRDIEESWRVSTDFWQKAFRDYQDEMERMARLNGDALNALQQELSRDDNEARHETAHH